MSVRVRRNGYRGEPVRTRFQPLLPNQRLCLKVVDDGPKRCVEPRRHKGKCKA